jgi:hypothetical protein
MPVGGDIRRRRPDAMQRDQSVSSPDCSVLQ